MKWKLTLIESITLITQMGILYGAWRYKWLATGIGPLYTAIFVFILGVIGGALLMPQKSNYIAHNHNLELIIRLVGAIIITAGAFLIFIPAASIFSHSGLATILFIFGVFSPWLMPKYLPKDMEVKNT